MNDRKPQLRLNEKVQLHIRVTQTHIDILNEMMEQIPGIKSYSEAIRYAILCMKEDVNTENLSKNVQRKISAMSKEISIIAEMVAGGFDAKEVKAIGKGKDTYIYKDARKNVENEIQTATTVKSNLKKSNMIKPELEIQLKEETIKKSSSLFE